MILFLSAAVSLAVWMVFANFLAGWLVVDDTVDRPDAIVVLSGAADYADRARGAADAFHHNPVSRVFITDDDQRGGWDDAENGNPLFVERMNRALVQHGVPRETIEILPGKVHGTDEEAELALRTAAERKYSRLLIVTSDYHSRRALWTFKRFAAENGVDITIGLNRAPTGRYYPGRITWWLTLRGWRSVAGEYVKFCWYWLYY